MRRLAVVGAVVLVLLFSHVIFAADDTAPGKDRLKINPIPPPQPREKEALEVIGDYIWNRFRDFADIFTIKLGWGTDMSLGFQLRAFRLLQIGAGVFEGYVFAIDRGCVGVMKEAEIEGGISIFYPTYLDRRIVWQSKEAERRNIFFGDTGKKGELNIKDMKMYDDGNQGWFTSTIQFQLPYLPKLELTLNWGELFDFPLSVLGIDGLRVPPAFYKRDGAAGDPVERIPAPSIFWHGQEEYENYE